MRRGVEEKTVAPKQAVWRERVPPGRIVSVVMAMYIRV